MFKNVLLLSLIALMASGCATRAEHKLTTPKGRWQPINQAGFIPPTATRYYKSNNEVQPQESSSAQIEQLSEFGHGDKVGGQ